MPAVSLPKTGHFMVLASTVAEAKRWAIEWRVPWSRVAYASSVRAIQGLQPSAVVYLPGWAEDGRHGHALIEYVDMLRRKYRVTEVKVRYHPSRDLSRGREW